MNIASVQDVWNECLEHVRAQLPNAASRFWFEETEPLSISDDVITLQAPHAFARDWIQSKYSGLLSDALQRTTGRPFRVEVVTSGNGIAVTPLPVSFPEPEPPAPLELEPSLKAGYTFETFVVGPSNRFAHAAAQAVAELPATAYNPLFIHGGAGLGKTHLLHAIGTCARQLAPHLKVKYVSSETFTNDLINAIKEDRTEAFRRRYREHDILLVDDIQFLENKEHTQEEFFHTFNALHNANRQIVITSDRAPALLTTLEERLKSRFMWGLMADVQPPDLETRIAILRRKAEAEKLTVPDDVLDFIATRAQSNIRELEGALLRIVAYSSLNKAPATLQLAEEVLENQFPGAAEPVRVDTILAESAAYFNLTVDDLRSPSRSRELVQARQIAMYLIRDMTELSLPRIGELFGGRDHSTVLHAMNRVRTMMSEQRSVYHQVQDLTARIRRRTGR